MKGVNKRIIEIEEPENEYIEKVQVFLRQDGNVRLAKSREEAQKYASGIVCWRHRMLPPNLRRPLMILASLLGLAALVAVVIFFLGV
ncbi:MAG: hypothetical protein RSF90_00690 [Pygmaiobacter sp.]